MRATNRTATVLLSLTSISISCAVVPSEPPSIELADAAEAASSQDFAADSAQAGRIARYLRAWHTGLLAAESEHLAGVIVGEARAAGIPPELVLAVIEVESGGRSRAVSPVGARGLMQILPTTGAFVADSTGLPWRGPDSLFDPAFNVRLGVRYLQQLMRRYPHLPTALAAYNWGPGHIAGRLRRGEPLPRLYADRVLSALAGAGREI